MNASRIGLSAFPSDNGLSSIVPLAPHRLQCSQKLEISSNSCHNGYFKLHELLNCSGKAARGEDDRGWQFDSELEKQSVVLTIHLTAPSGHP